MLLLRLMLVLRLLWPPRRHAAPPAPGVGAGLAILRTRSRHGRDDTDAPAPRWRQSLHSMVEDQSDDLWGLAFLLLGVLSGLGIYGEVIGPAGHVLRSGTADLLGLARYAIPPALAVLGAYLIWHHQRPEPGRVTLGLALALFGTAGLLEVVVGKDTVHQSLRSMGQAGGLAGAGEGVPLQAGIGSWGAALVLGAILFVACLIITATPARAVAGKLRSFGASAIRATRWLFFTTANLLRAGARAAAAARHPSVQGPALAYPMGVSGARPRRGLLRRRGAPAR